VEEFEKQIYPPREILSVIEFFEYVISALIMVFSNFTAIVHIGNIVYIKAGEFPPVTNSGIAELLVHEAIHTIQVEALKSKYPGDGRARFVTYCANNHYSDDNIFEVAAYKFGGLIEPDFASILGYVTSIIRLVLIMKKNLIIFIGVVIIIQNIQSQSPGYDGESEFRLLNPEQQLEYILKNYNQYPDYRSLWCLSRIEILAENPEIVKPLLFKYLEEMNPPPPRDLRDLSDMRFDIIFYITWREFYIRNKFFNSDESEQLANLLQEKIDYSLRTYKKVNNWLCAFEICIVLIKTGVDIGPRKQLKNEILQKYKDLGYNGLTVDAY
jgi:hypothetical protein